MIFPRIHSWPKSGSRPILLGNFHVSKYFESSRYSVNMYEVIYSDRLPFYTFGFRNPCLLCTKRNSNEPQSHAGQTRSNDCS